MSIFLPPLLDGTGINDAKLIKIGIETVMDNKKDFTQSNSLP